ncbi:MAG: bifunctional diaminohydroxyphosphoribosylaminopyrimidine deaminase/5-amino-6-(5-phosphoribosylamino)uracil reductase RibD [Ferruginibacter sp.]|nr:bifunctional diaminohydroxyphosphoribosylaminopyrimidine deaminase/5-amino-6-(5-phosphoribosylamino)uracil reductase RibD [Ferruginibacter sp.]
MKRCLQLAEIGLADVAPNPMVGAVLVHEGRIIGEGYHKKFGQAHAEVNCINSVKEEDAGLIVHSTLYVSLEPCNHHGKTPPCSDLIIDNKIPSVVIACKDPFSKVDGTGIQKLKQAGVDVLFGILEEEAKELNRRFFTFHLHQRPYVILKWAQTADGFIGTSDRKPLKITNDLTDTIVHKWRSEEASIIVGNQTAVSDNPSLTTRHWPGKNPVRIFVDWDLRLPSTHHLLDGSVPTVIINQHQHHHDGNNLFFQIPQKEDLIAALMKLCFVNEWNSIIVEGGSVLLKSFIEKGIWDEARVIVNTSMNTLSGLSAPELKNNRLLFKQQSGNDSVSYYRRAD